MLSLSCTAIELMTEALNVVRESPPQFLYCSAETVLEKAFLAAVKENSALHQAVSAIVVDESHTEEAWTGQRKKQSKGAKPVQVFRAAYGKLAILRSMRKDGIPLLALTGTADRETEKTVIKELATKDPVKLFVRPNRCKISATIYQQSWKN
ncbi:unnamed protein product [Porites evermanni]|uniref:DNA 3'-5' helicase n=1 Tax=Porites evermanni TaxID=104178 RepID=A0ABN8MCR6_9CNID|nr:unnamed protein product [Porites evermanni]